MLYYELLLQKKADNLGIAKEELSVWGIQDGQKYTCIMEDKETNNETDFFICEIKNTHITKIELLMVNPLVMLHQVHNAEVNLNHVKFQQFYNVPSQCCLLGLI